MTLYEALERYTTPNFGGCTQFEKIGNDILDTEEESKLYNLIRNVASIKLVVLMEDVKFRLELVLGSGGEKYGLSDISENDFKLLESIDLEKLPIYIRYKIADLLWTERRCYPAAITAFNSYLELFESPQEYENYMDVLNTIYRAVAISKRLNKKEFCDRACKLIRDKITKHDAKHKGFFTLELLEILVRQRIGSDEFKVSEINKLISNTSSSSRLVERAYLLLIEFYELKCKCESDVKETKLRLANEYEIEFAKLEQSKNINVIRDIYTLRKAFGIYAEYKESESANRVLSKIGELQAEFPKSFQPIVQEYDVSNTYGFLENSFNELSLEESIIFLSELTHFMKRENVKKAIISDSESEEDISPIYFVTRSIVNEKGQITYKLKPLDMDDPESDDELLDDHIHTFMNEFESIWGSITLNKALQIIRRNYSLSLDDLDFLICENYLIPEGKEQIFKSAIFMALCGQYYEAVHILAPQMENLFRELAGEVGEMTFTLDEHGISEAKTLTAVLKSSRLKDAFDNDILFVFEGLLNKKVGGNIRNEVAHGILSEKGASSGVCIYFICAVIRLLTTGATKCRDIIYSSEKLDMIDDISKDILPIRIGKYEV